jgi:hypothetical protein
MASNVVVALRRENYPQGLPLELWRNLWKNAPKMTWKDGFYPWEKSTWGVSGGSCEAGCNELLTQLRNVRFAMLRTVLTKMAMDRHILDPLNFQALLQCAAFIDPQFAQPGRAFIRWGDWKNTSERGQKRTDWGQNKNWGFSPRGAAIQLASCYIMVNLRMFPGRLLCLFGPTQARTQLHPFVCGVWTFRSLGPPNPQNLVETVNFVSSRMVFRHWKTRSQESKLHVAMVFFAISTSPYFLHQSFKPRVLMWYKLYKPNENPKQSSKLGMLWAMVALGMQCGRLLLTLPPGPPLCWLDL